MRYAAIQLNAGQHYSSLDSSQQDGCSIDSGRHPDNLQHLPSQYAGQLHGDNRLQSPSQVLKPETFQCMAKSPGEDLKNVYTFKPFIVQSMASPQLSYFNKGKKSTEKRQQILSK